MTRERRLAGRAVRKRRRAVSRMDWAALQRGFDALGKAFAKLAAAVSGVIQQVVQIIVAIGSEYAIRVAVRERRVLRATTLVNQDC